MPNKKSVIFIVGPTASGKSRVAAALAKKINAEIISCDSMQLYKGMDILTSSPSAALMKRIKHHLIGTIAASREFNVYKYRREALKAVKKILKKGKTPLFTGGTGLYVSALIDGIFSAGKTLPDLRIQLYSQAETLGSNYLHRELSKVDRQAAKRIHPHDTKRIIRALEVFQATGKPISELQKNRQGLAKDYTVKIFCLNPPREKLYKMINARVEEMFRQGLLSQARCLLKKKLSRTAAYAIGLNELSGYLNGLYGLEEAKRRIKLNTRHYAKRQLTWFRRDKRIEWIKLKTGETPQTTSGRIFKKLKMNLEISKGS